MPMYDYECSCGHCFEAIKSMTQRYTADCPECGREAVQMLSTPTVKLDALSGDFPGETMKWEKKRNQKMAQERKHSSYDG